MDGLISILLFAFGVALVAYVGYFIGHMEGFRKGINVQRKIDRNEF